MSDQANGCHRGIFTIDGPLGGYEFPTTVSFRPLADRVWTASDGIYRTIFLEGDEGVICFDTFWSPAAAGSYRQAVQRVFPTKPIHTIVYSHEHLDHTGFALDLEPEAHVIAHQEAADVIAARRSDGQVVPHETWAGESKHFAIDGVEFDLINPGPTHGNGNVAAHFPEHGLVFMADTVSPGVRYAFMPDYHFSRYVPSMRKIERLEWDEFVPGHFWSLDRAGFAEDLAYYEWLEEAAQEALFAGVDPDVYAEVAAYCGDHWEAERGRLFRYHEFFAMNVMRMMVHFRTGGWGLEDVEGAR